MVGSQKVLDVLTDARDLVRKQWGTTNQDGRMDEGTGSMCASVAITEANRRYGDRLDVADAAHEAFLAGAGITLDPGKCPYLKVYAFNDAQVSREPVLAAFDRAIALLDEQDPTPSADAALEVMEACDRAGESVARYIVADHPEMDVREIWSLTSAELFYAAQDCARSCDLSVELERS